MKYYVIAGEASGDLHGSNLIKELHSLDQESDIRSWGGELMKDAGSVLVKHYKELAFMGFVEVIKNLPTILRNLSFCKKDIREFNPDVLILIDYPGFNLRIAEWAKEQGYKVVYYISPQIWAWKENRIHAIKRCVDKMLTILPFEKDYYQKWNYDVDYVGHPLVEVIENYSRNKKESDLVENSKKIIALLPGSRKQEIKMKLPIMLSVTTHFPDFQFIVAKAPGLEENFYNEMMEGYFNVSFVSNKTYDLLSVAKAALVTSGTATLETALFGVPEIICYKGNPISFAIAKKLVKIKFIGLVNLIMDKEVVKELIQSELTTENIIRELESILDNSPKRMKIESDYRALKQILSKGGNASRNAAEIIVNLVVVKSL